MTPAQIAAAQFERRQSLARQDIAARRMTVTEAEAKLLPWLALAALADAELDELYCDMPVLAPAARAGEDERTRLLPEAIWPIDEALRMLGRARDKAVDRVTDEPPADPKRLARARQDAQDLAVLAAWLGAPPCYHPSLADPASESQRIAA